MIDLSSKVCLLTGAGGAIGSATARRLASLGATVLLHDVSGEAVELVAEELGEPASALVGDLDDPSQVEALWQTALQIHGRIDSVINNAGIYPPAPLSLSLDDWLGVWQNSLSVNLIAPAILCRSAVLDFSQKGGGILVNMASRAAFRGEDPDYWHYAAAKAGIVAMTKTIARQYGRQGVTAYAVAPGYVDTKFNQAFRDEFGVEAAAEATGLGEVAQPEDVAHLLAFLVSGLARHMTGSTIDINSASYVR